MSDRLFELVNSAVGEKDPGHVCLSGVHVPRSLTVRRRIAQEAHLRRQVRDLPLPHHRRTMAAATPHFDARQGRARSPLQSAKYNLGGRDVMDRKHTFNLGYVKSTWQCAA